MRNCGVKNSDFEIEGLKSYLWSNTWNKSTFKSYFKSVW